MAGPKVMTKYKAADDGKIYLPPRLRRRVVKGFIYSRHSWDSFAREDQRWVGKNWLIWLLLGGRGSGKTRTGAEWVHRRVLNGAMHIALIGPSYNAAREVMVEGESGLLSVGRETERPIYISSRHRLEWPGGAVGHIFSAEDPDALRGPQFDYAWADEFCAWSYPQDTLSNLRLGLRLGVDPRLVVTTTPKPIKALKELRAQKSVYTSRAKTSDNAKNLAPTFLDAVNAAYGQTRLGRQELGGEIIEDAAGALWTRDSLAACTAPPPERFDKVIIAVDPPVTSGARSDACGIIIAGLLRGAAAREDKVFILHDGTVQGLSPDAWAARVVGFWDSYDADYVLVEVNQGGEMVSAIIRHQSPETLVKSVYASRGKAARAEPVSALYSQGRVHHIRTFPELDDELASLGTEAQIRGGHSPDRADALVWAVTDLLLAPRQTPRIRQI